MSSWRIELIYHYVKPHFIPNFPLVFALSEIDVLIPTLKFYFYFCNPYPRTLFKIDFRKRGGWEGERQTDRQNQKHQLVVSHICPDQALNPQPRYVP